MKRRVFAKGAFRKESKATSIINSLEHWVIKKDRHESQETMQTLLDIARNLDWHSIIKAYTLQFAMLDNYPVTVEEFVEGESQKYVNNTQFAPPPWMMRGEGGGEGGTESFFRTFI